MRHSQLITTYGPGAMVDLPDHSVVIGGLNLWSYGADQTPEDVDEPRLLTKLRQTLKVPTLKLQKPPVQDTGPGGSNRGGGIRSPQFPNWFVAQLDQTEVCEGRRYRTRPLVEGRRLEKGKYLDVDRKSHRVVPVRFVQSCPNGHLSDIEWREFVHGGRTNCTTTLWLDEAGSGNDFTEIYVRCPRCEIRRRLSEAKQKTKGEDGDRPALGYCQGHRPWLGSYGQEQCVADISKPGGYPNRLLVRSASNAYFPELISAISIPEPIDAVREVIGKHLKQFEKINSAEKLAFWLEDFAPEHIAQFLKGQDPEQIYVALEAVRGNSEQAPPNSEALKLQELRALIGPVSELKREQGKNSFEAEEVDLSGVGSWFSQRVTRVLKVHRMREVMALLGFTRLEAVVSQIDGDPLDLGVKRAAIDVKELTWLPAIENLGEGIFLQFSKSQVEGWLKSDGVRQQLSKHEQAFQAWNREHGLTKEKFGWPGGGYLMLHSLAHLLITQAALDCGYGASAIKERIYAFPGIGYGILLYTGGSGSEGTLGGLVALTDRVEDLLKASLESGSLCSNDPFCSGHEPNDPLEKRYAHGAACHGCLLIAETSCERRNEFLDRALVVPTLQTDDAAFFPADLID
ncbi:DUF1998 domain-containing protein [Cyanobium sp. HWJ4-Hawea]|nr:DUF1998 domain-containing protein [Cyanobium sp. HWJ4-Hawea]